MTKSYWWLASTVVLLLAAFAAGWLIRGGLDRPHDHGDQQSAASQTIWTCPMHPQVQRPENVPCPICGMDLVPLTDVGGSATLTMSEEARKLAEIETAPVERRYPTKRIRMVGKVDYDETRVRTISARVSGWIERLFVDFTGIRVKTGDHLVELYSPELLTAQQELIGAVEQMERQRRDGGAPGESDARLLETARHKLQLMGLTEDQVREIEERGVAADRVTIRSPIAGVVINKAVEQGDYVRPGTMLSRIADLQHLWLKLDAYEQDLPWIRYGQQVSIETEAIPGRVFRGWISFIAPTVDPTTRTISLRVNIDNPGEVLKPGMFARAYLSSRLADQGKVLDPRFAGKWICPMHPEVVKDGPGDCDVCGMDLESVEDLGYVTSEAVAAKPLVVPASAVLRTGRRAIVYVADARQEEPTFEGREVVLGPRAGDDYIVLSGLKDGELVVVNGAFKIDSELQLRAKPSMMSMEGEAAWLGAEAAVFRTQLQPLLARYFEAQESLADDNEAVARAALVAMKPLLAKVDDSMLESRGRSVWEDERALLTDALARLDTATGLDGLRRLFRSISEVFMDIEKAFGHAGDAIYDEVVCSMAFGNNGAAWLQREGEIANPYYGSEMLRCGDLRTKHVGQGAAASEQETHSQQKQGESQPAPTPESRPSAATGAATFAPLLKPTYDDYFAAQEGLAADDLSSAKSSAAGLAGAVSAVDDSGLDAERSASWKELSMQLHAAATATAEASDIASARAAFRGASEAMLAIEKTFGHTGADKHFKAFCPMAFESGAPWLQRSPKVNNPYYGASMLRCGSIVETYVPASEER